MMYGEWGSPFGRPTANSRGRLWEPGYRERYYQQKFGVDVSDRDFISQYVLQRIYVLPS